MAFGRALSAVLSLVLATCLCGAELPLFLQRMTQQPNTPGPRPSFFTSRSPAPDKYQPQSPIFQTRPQRESTPGKYQPQSPFFQTRPQPQRESTPGKYQPPRPAVTAAAPFQRCQVDDFDRIQCGELDISRADCDTISCCYDGRQCYYGKAVTLQCTRDGQFVVVVAKDATLPHLSLDSIRLLEGSCGLVGSTAAYAIYQFPVSSCGTKMTELEGYVLYDNMMSSSYEVGIGPRGSISRDSVYELSFQCRYSTVGVEALVVEVGTVPPPAPVAQQGPLRVVLRLADGICTAKGGCADEEMYTSYYTEAEYPVTKLLREPVYVEVLILERSDPSLVLSLDHCWGTSTPNPLSLPQWDLLIAGCPYQDDRYMTTKVPVARSSGLVNPTHYQRFVVKMFTFVDNVSLLPLQERVFIHCSTSVCHPSATESCEQRCDLRTRRAVAEDQDSAEKAVVSSGELVLTTDMPVSSRSQADGAAVSRSLGYGLLGVAAMVVFGIFSLVLVILWRSRPLMQTTWL